MDKHSKIFVAGHNGLVGSAITRELTAQGFSNLVLSSRRELDLLNQSAVHRFFQREKVDYVFVAAARVGGIQANRTYPANFIYENLQIACNLIHAAAQAEVKKLLYLGSSCIYPKHAEQPIKEEALLSGPLELTNEAYAIAKIAGLKLCQYYKEQYGCRFISAMPTNLYGPNDNYNSETSHVLPALIRKFHEAKVTGKPFVKVWGSGKPRREVLHVDDLARALFVLMRDYEATQFVNVGCGNDVTIAALAETIASAVGYRGEIQFDTSMPDGTPRKLLDVSRMKALGWKPEISLEQGIKNTYLWAVSHGVLAPQEGKPATQEKVPSLKLVP